MPITLLLHRLSEESLCSPEMVDLGSYVAGQARRVFEGLEVQSWSQEPPNRLPTGVEMVLVIDGPGILTSASSLEAMRQAVMAGAAAALPEPMGTLPELATEPVYTLRGFERLERCALARGAQMPGGRQSHLPIALFSAETLRQRIEEVGWEAALTDPEIFAEKVPGFAHVGIYHQFIDYYGEAREDILPFLPSPVEDVLEVGCGRGITGALLQEKLGCRVTGVELNPEVAAAARQRLHEVLVGDVEEMQLPGRYDAVVATELFEHLNYPRRFLERARGLLRPGGRVVLSVPNVGHWSVVEDLLAGRWDYLPIGLLCFTHFRFFTRATLEDWLGRDGRTRFEIIAQKTELPSRFDDLPARLAVDRESLATKGFYVLVEAEGTTRRFGSPAGQP